MLPNFDEKLGNFDEKLGNFDEKLGNFDENLPNSGFKGVRFRTKRTTSAVFAPKGVELIR